MRTLAFKAGQSAAGGLGAEWEVCQTMQSNMSALEPTVLVARESWAYDGWNQTATPETCQTLRACNSQGEGNDAIVKVFVLRKDGRR